MAVFERMELKKRRPVPNWIKLVLLVMVLFGIYIRSCWKEKQVDQIQISNIEIGDFTNSTIDIHFSALNSYNVDLTKPIIIKVFLDQEVELASRLTSIDIPANSNKNYLKVLNRFIKPLNNLDEIKEVTVEVYNP